MGLKYLWDTNTVIYYLQKQLSVAGEELMSGIINNNQPTLSVITQIELLCWKTATEKDVAVLNNFISDSVVIELEQAIKMKTVEIRKTYNIKLPNAIIAATAMEMDLILITNDKSDFKNITSLQLINPFTL